jgi:cell division septation protein DedD
MMIAAVLAGAIMLGGGSMYAYKALLGGPHAGEPPVVKSASQPSKVKPEDGGGKQFAHTDSKVMGRLGDGSDTGEGPDANGTRKVSTLVVGRDGSIQAPQAEPAAAANAVNPPIRVPGLTVVDGLGTSRQAAVPPPPPAPERQQIAQVEERAVAPVVTAKVVNSQTQKPAPIKVTPPAEATGSIEPEVEMALAEPAAAPPAAKPKKPNPAAADAASTSVATTGSGFVAVLASVPRSDSSRMDALKQFADMQQKYGTVLSGKTPDVAEANLGAKGNYHRLVVGPPGSREQASSLCTQLKSQGYTNCWVTSY